MGSIPAGSINIFNKYISAIVSSVDEMTELKELVRRNIALSEDTRRMVRDMRREIWWGRFFRVLWMIVTVVIVLAVYYYYLRPYVQQIEALYKYIQPQVVQSHNLDTQLSNFMKTHFSQ